ncbi:MAG: hypothetical protein ACD_2C00197G0008 [uncultured bacterium (gcode 4)]|uniref:NB-ARC domain-containing protein n=1 Tax=uncultured bacterium (gcode 4) TaxID=1234023 RepID=K2G4K9_9BACT|nr:MAG: hypothetical protein ACD_2C00197G0008 [uncultured bacterium (gcode 4)]
MNYFLKRLNDEIRECKNLENQDWWFFYEQIRFEFIIIFILSYFFDKNFQLLDIDLKSEIIEDLSKPSIWTLISIIRKLDKDWDLQWTNRYLMWILDVYPWFRNNTIWHWYVFWDKKADFAKYLENLYKNLMSKTELSVTKGELWFINENSDIIYIENISPWYSNWYSISHDWNKTSWNCPLQTKEFDPNHVYCQLWPYKYFCLSPFIHIEDTGKKMYLFKWIKDILSLKVQYNQLFETSSNFCKEWPKIWEMTINEEWNRQISINKTIRNKITLNDSIETYIQTWVEEDVKEFLISNRSSVAATIWWHWWVWKTALIQYVNNEIFQNSKKYFDYIIFLSFKDRRYNWYRWQIEEISSSERITCFTDVIRRMNEVIFSEESDNIDNIVNNEDKILTIIDDFETIEENEKKSIINFIDKLNVNNHKVIITTRTSYLTNVWKELPIKEFDVDKTIEFLLKYIHPKLGFIQYETIKNQINEEIKKQIFNVTSWRPLFILQFWILLIQNKNIKASLDRSWDIKNSEEAIEFLYWRIYNSLSEDAQNAFVAIWLLVDKDKPVGEIDRIKFILNIDESKFVNSFEELIKLKIVEIKWNELFTVYAPEIIGIMRKYLKTNYNCVKYSEKYNEISKGVWPIGNSLLIRANDLRDKDPQNAVVSYLELINNKTYSKDIRKKAILNLANFYKLYLWKSIEDYIDLFKDNYDDFINDIDYSLTYSSHLNHINTDSSRKESMNILLSVNKKYSLDDDDKLKVLSLIVINLSRNIILERNNLNTQSKYKEILEDDYYKRRKEIRVVMRNIDSIYWIGLFNKIKKNIDRISSNGILSEYCISALKQYTEICIRINKYEEAKEICIFCINNFKEHGGFFEAKKTLAEYFQKNNT